MKKILIALALIASVGSAYAQVKSASDLKKSVASAEAATQDAKKAAKVATWLKLGKAYMDAYNNPTANILGSTRQELKLVMSSEKELGSEIVTLGGQSYEKVKYADKNLYFNNNGLLAITEVTKPVFKEDVLAKALAAYTKAAEVDVKGSKTKDITGAVNTIVQDYYKDAFNAYYLGNSAVASDNFAKAAEASLSPLSSQVDTASMYYAGLTALEAKDYDKAETQFKKAYQYGYYSDGSIFANLSDICMNKKDTLAARKYLEDGFAAYPENAQIMTNLINLYITTKEDPKKLISLLDLAKKEMPDNPSLYYVEGDIWGQLKEYDNAIAAYRKAGEVNPEYEMGWYGEGVLNYNRALETQEEANALPYNEYKKYQELSDLLAVYLKNCIEPFEKCFSITKNDAVKTNVADYLKRIYFIFRSESPEYMSLYEKYDAYLKGSN